MLLREWKAYCGKCLGPVMLAWFACISSSCAELDTNKAPYANTVKSPTMVGFSQKQNAVESHLYTTKLGDAVSLRFPSSLFFVNDTANSLPNYHQHIDQLVNIIKRYPHNVIQINVNFQVSGDNQLAVEVASSQARYFSSTLSQHIHSGFSSSDGDIVMRSNILNNEYAAIGNFIEVVLR